MTFRHRPVIFHDSSHFIKIGVFGFLEMACYGKKKNFAPKSQHDTTDCQLHYTYVCVHILIKSV